MRNTLIEVEEHNVAGIVYPVTADPWWIPVAYYAMKLSVPVWKVAAYCASQPHNCARTIDGVLRDPHRINSFRNWLMRTF